MLDPEEAYYKLLEVYGENVIASKTDLKGNIVYVSDAFCKASGYTRKELMGQSHSIVRHPDTPSSIFEELWKTIKNSKTFNTQMKNKRKDNTYYWIDLTISPILDDFNNIVGYTAVSHDISTQKKLEELNFEHEKLINTFSKNVIASKTDLKGKITYVSEAFCKISGYSKDELIGNSHNIVRHPDMPKTFYKNLWQLIKNGRDFNGEIKNKKKNGKEYWVEVSITADYDRNNKHIGYTSIRIDITKQKLLEKKLLEKEKEQEG